MSEAFVYCWTDFGTNKLYVGVHKGTPDDGYVCSSKPMLEEYTKRPNDFSRQIIAHGSFPEMYVLENAILKVAKADKDPRFYNQALNVGPFYTRGPLTDVAKEKIRAAQILYNKRPEVIARKSLELVGNKRAANIPHTPEWKRDNSIRMKGNRYAVGKRSDKFRKEQAIRIEASWVKRKRKFHDNHN